MKITVDKNKCPGNHVCPAMKKCPVNAIRQEGLDAPVVDQEKCIKCYKCVEFCPIGAFQDAAKTC